MAKQYKKLQRKIHPKTKENDKQQEKPGKDYMMIGIIIFTLMVLILGWPYLDNMNRVMYILLSFSLSLTYIRRHAKLSETQTVLIERASFISIGFAIALFVIIVYYQYFG